jgi:hypothetical protein
MAQTLQKVSNRNLVLSANAQAAYGGVLADANLTQRQRADASSVFTAKPSNRTDKGMIGKGTEFATDDTITAWDTDGSIKCDADIWVLGWMLAFIFGQDTVTGAGPYTHQFTLPEVTAVVPCTTIYVEESAVVHRKFQDMSAKSLSLSIPERGALSASLDLVGTGRWTPGSMNALPALAALVYLLGSDMQLSITPTAGALVSFVGRQSGISVKIDRGTAPHQSSGDGLFASCNASGDLRFSFDGTIDVESTEDVNTWFEAGTRCAITLATNPANTYQVGFTFPSVRIKANKVGQKGNVVTWSLSWDETTCINNGAQPALSAMLINNTATYLVPA